MQQTALRKVVTRLRILKARLELTILLSMLGVYQDVLQSTIKIVAGTFDRRRHTSLKCMENIWSLHSY